MGQKLGAFPLWGGGAGSPSNTMWPGPRPTCTLNPTQSINQVLSWSVQPFGHTNVADRQTDRQTGQRSDRIAVTEKNWKQFLMTKSQVSDMTAYTARQQHTVHINWSKFNQPYFHISVGTVFLNKAWCLMHTCSTTGLLPNGRSCTIVTSVKPRIMFWMMRSTVLQTTATAIQTQCIHILTDHPVYNAEPLVYTSSHWKVISKKQLVYTICPALIVLYPPTSLHSVFTTACHQSTNRSQTWKR